MESLIGITRIHLIGFFVAALNVTGGANGVTERAVVARGIFGGVGHDLSIDEIIFL